jgi:hypothetical protein
MFSGFLGVMYLKPTYKMNRKKDYNLFISLDLVLLLRIIPQKGHPELWKRATYNHLKKVTHNYTKQPVELFKLF